MAIGLGPGQQQVLERPTNPRLRYIEPGVSAGLVAHVSGRCEGLITALSGECRSLLPGYRVRILDGNHLAATQRRLGVTRGTPSGLGPGSAWSSSTRP